MTPERHVAGLDIGSSKTTAIIAEVIGELPRHPGIKVLGVGQARTTGLRRGVVADIEEATRSIKKALTDAERMSGARVEHLYTGIAGEHMEAMISKGIVIVSGDDQASHGAIVSVMDEVRLAGVSRLAIAVRSERRAQP